MSQWSCKVAFVVLYRILGGHFPIFDVNSSAVFIRYMYAVVRVLSSGKVIIQYGTIEESM